MIDLYIYAMLGIFMLLAFWLGHKSGRGSEKLISMPEKELKSVYMRDSLLGNDEEDGYEQDRQ